MIQTILAPAKINLGLEVLYKRIDGYHELNTLFLRVIKPCDTIRVTRSGFFQLTNSGDFELDGGNIMMRAAQEFEKLTGQPNPRIHVHLEKRIPIGAGLGGGSSDAAAMLQILRDNAENKPEMGKMMGIGAKIGADVPFFLSGETAMQASGIGEKLTPITPLFFQKKKSHNTPAFLIIVDPAIQISTKEAYSAISTSVGAGKLDLVEWSKSPPPLAQWKEYLRNDFEPEIFRRFPQLAAMKHAMYTHGAEFSLMSGSGSAIYGIFKDSASAQAAQQAFENEGLMAFLS